MEKWLAPTHMMLVNLRKYFTDRSLYDYKSDKWTTVTSAKQDAGIFSVCLAINKNLVLITGGRNYNVLSNEAYLYRVSSREMKKVASMKTARILHCMARKDGIAYVIGGADDQGITGHCEQYDLSRNQWSSMKYLNQVRAGASACVINDKVYVFGG